MAIQVRHVSSDSNISRWRIGSLQVQGVSESHTRTDQTCTLRLRLLTVSVRYQASKAFSVSRTCMQWSLVPACQQTCVVTSAILRQYELQHVVLLGVMWSSSRMLAENYSFPAGPTLNTTVAPGSLAAVCPIATRYAVLTFP